MTDSFEPITDDELAALALAADPDTTVSDDAVCLWDVAGMSSTHRLPDWYMPSPVGGAISLDGWRRRVVRLNLLLIVLSFLVINACGLCNTYGQLGLG
jgi:hypothetical protein